MILINNAGGIVFKSDAISSSDTLREAIYKNKTTIDLNLSTHRLESIDFTGVLCNYNSYNSARVYSCNFTDCDMFRSKMTHSVFTDCSFQGVNLCMSKLQYATFTRCQFFECNLEGSNIENCEFNNCTVKRTFLTKGSVELLLFSDNRVNIINNDSIVHYYDDENVGPKWAEIEQTLW